MANINTRIKLRYDLYSNWASNDPVLLAGEVALAYIPAESELSVDAHGNKVAGTTPPQVLIKVGDGTHPYSELKYVSALAADVLNACKSDAALTTYINNVIAEAGIATDEAMTVLANRVKALEDDRVTTAELEAVDAKFANYKTATEQKAIDDAQDEATQKVADDLAAYQESNDTALAGVKATAEAAVTTEALATALAPYITAADVAATYETKENATAKLAEAKKYTDDKIAEIPAQIDYAVTITETTDGLADSIAKKYTFTQNNVEIGSINLAKELVVTSGSVKEVTEDNVPYEGAKTGDKYIELVIANQDAPIYVPAKDLVDIYTATENATEVQVAISNENKISATLVNGGVTEEKLAETVKTKLNKTWEEVGTAQTLVDSLANGQVKTNKEAIDAINNAETGILAQVANSYETKGTAQSLIDALKLGDTYEAKGTAAGLVQALEEGQVATNAQGIADNKNAIEAIYKVDGENKSGVLVDEIARVEGKADANATAIAAINNETTGILALAKAHTDAAIANINVGITGVASGHEAITVNVVNGVATVGLAEDIVINCGDSQ